MITQKTIQIYAAKPPILSQNFSRLIASDELTQTLKSANTARSRLLMEKYAVRFEDMSDDDRESSAALLDLMDKEPISSGFSPNGIKLAALFQKYSKTQSRTQADR